MLSKLASAEYYYTKIIDFLKMNHTRLDRSTFRLDNDKVLIMRYSSLHETSKPHYWFGLQKEKFNSYPAEHLYVVFICGSHKNTFIIPATYLKELLQGVKTGTDNSWKFNIYYDDYSYQLWVSGKPLKDITRFLNKFEQLGDLTIRPPEQPENFENSIMQLDDIPGNSVHEKAINMIKQIGDWMRYKAVTKYKLHPDISTAIEVAWLLEDALEIAVEVYQSDENILEIRERLVLAKRLGARKCIIIINPRYKQKLIELKSLFQYENEIKHWLELWSLEKIYIMYINVRKFINDFHDFRKAKYSQDIIEFL